MPTHTARPVNGSLKRRTLRYQTFGSGQRDAEAATGFIADLESRLAHRVQLTSDGLKLYLYAVIDAFAAEIDYAQLVKYFGNSPEGQKRYSPAVCTGAGIALFWEGFYSRTGKPA